jgi:hypothetical protein
MPYEIAVPNQHKKYLLKSMVQHYGDVGGGHYVAFLCSNPGTFWRCDDSTITQIDKMQFDGERRSGYMYYYEMTENITTDTPCESGQTVATSVVSASSIPTINTVARVPRFIPDREPTTISRVPTRRILPVASTTSIPTKSPFVQKTKYAQNQVVFTTLTGEDFSAAESFMPLPCSVPDEVFHLVESITSGLTQQVGRWMQGRF